MAQQVAKQIQAKLVLGEYDLGGDDSKVKTCPTFNEYYYTYRDGFSRLKHKVGTQDNLKCIVEKPMEPQFGWIL